MEVDDNDKPAGELSTTNDTQIIAEDGPSAVSKTSGTNAEQEAKKLPSADINERDLKAAAASALAAAAVKAKVSWFFLSFDCESRFLFAVLGIDRRTQDQISCGSSGRNADQEIRNQTTTLRRTGNDHGS